MHTQRVQKWKWFGEISSSGAYKFGISKVEGVSAGTQAKINILRDAYRENNICKFSLIWQKIKYRNMNVQISVFL